MSCLGVVDAPSAGDTADIRCEVYLRVLKGKLLADAALAEAVTVAKTQFYVVSAGLVVGPVHGIQGRVLVAVDCPYSICLCRHIGNREGSLVHRLIYAHVDVHIRDGGDTILIRTIERFRRAGCECCRKSATYETCTE